MLGVNPQLGHGAEVRFVAAPTPYFEIAAETPLAVFQRFEDLWLVTSDEALTLQPLPASLSIIENEQLYMPSGAGVRLSFSVLSGVRVTRDANNWKIYLNQENTPENLDLSLSVAADTVTIKSTITPLRATSFNTRETYTALPALEARGFAAPETIGVLRRLRSAVGAVFVTSNGAPLGMTQEEGKAVFKTMNNAISEAVARREAPINLSVVESLLEAAKDGVAKPAHPQFNRTYHAGLKIPAIDVENETTLENAVNQMNRALDQVDNLSYPLPTSKPAEEKAPNLAAVPVPSVDNPVQEALQARDKATTPTPQAQAPKALPESQLLPNFGDRTRRELEALERRLGQRWYFAQKNTDKIAAANRFAGLKIFMQHYPEALGIVRTVLDNNENTAPELVADTKMLEVVTLALMGRYPEAAEKIAEVSGPLLDKAIWSGFIEEGMGAPKKAVKDLAETVEKAAAYPPLLTQKIRYAYAKALYEEGLLNEALNQIDRLALLGGRGRVLPMAQLLMGRIYEDQGQLDLAEQVFITLASNSDLEVSSHALYHFLTLLTKRGDLTPEAAAIRFENLRFLWRGDEVEENSLNQLANLYIQSKQYKKTLERLKYLTVNFPESAFVPQAAAQMTKIFSDLFLGHRNDAELDPLGMLGLYYEFRELTPADTEGDQVVMNVANRLSSLGLYARAVETLERQLKFRAKDANAVGQLGLELAKLHQQNFAAGEGLKALKDTANAKLPENLKNDRQVMRAQLLGLAMQYDDALQAAQRATGQQAQDLQAEYAWELGDFNAVIKAVTPMFDAAGGSEWTADDITRFLRLTTALAAANETEKLKNLLIRYEQGIQQHNLAEQLAFLAEAAHEESPAVRATEAALASPEALGVGASVWLRGERSLKRQNDFNRDYRRLRTQWAEENKQADRSEMKAIQDEITANQPRFR